MSFMNNKCRYIKKRRRHVLISLSNGLCVVETSRVTEQRDKSRVHEGEERREQKKENDIELNEMRSV